MELRTIILSEIGKVPEEYLGEILDFIRFIEVKAIKEGMETAIASETSLRKDWMKAEEDEAWQDL